MNIDSERDRIQIFVDKGNYHAAINIALSALNECRRNNDQKGVDLFLEVIRGIVRNLSDQFGSKA
ncbi:MAG: hypothetical protein KAQ67_01325 [Gammaproteobacteria bacterium]|nr:hypothetical protein [Gammaproteobacteria bacterium]MCK5334766.1 hypothetical protein [Gammaproteobacteria bacterium]